MITRFALKQIIAGMLLTGGIVVAGLGPASSSAGCSPRPVMSGARRTPGATRKRCTR